MQLLNGHAMRPRLLRRRQSLLSGRAFRAVVPRRRSELPRLFVLVRRHLLSAGPVLLPRGRLFVPLRHRLRRDLLTAAALPRAGCRRAVVAAGTTSRQTDTGHGADAARVTLSIELRIQRSPTASWSVEAAASNHVRSKRWIAQTTASVVAASLLPWPASLMMINSLSGQAWFSCQANSSGPLMSSRP